MMFESLVGKGFEIAFTSHARAILLHDFPELIAEIEGALGDVTLPMSEIIGSGGGEAKMTQRLRKALAQLGWPKHVFNIAKMVDGTPRESTTHEIDHVRRTDAGSIAFEIEWNNKDPFFDRDLENFKRLHAEGAISVGGIITRGSAMQAEMFACVMQFAAARSLSCYEDLQALDLTPTKPQRDQIDRQVALGKSFAEAWARKFVADKYGAATTHWTKLMDRVARGVGNPCPLVLIGLPPDIIDMAT